jgi:hypothetical protein
MVVNSDASGRAGFWVGFGTESLAGYEKGGKCEASVGQGRRVKGTVEFISPADKVFFFAALW